MPLLCRADDLGDVVEEADGDLMGDGVNIAARLEGIAAPGAICLSEDAYRQVKGRLDLAISDLGPKELKNIAEPVRVYSLEVGKPAQAKPASDRIPTRNSMRRSGGRPALRSARPVCNFDGAAHGVDHTAKLDQRPVAGAFHDTPIMHGNRLVDEIASQRPEPRQREAAESDDIGGQDRGEFAGFGHRALFAGFRVAIFREQEAPRAMLEGLLGSIAERRLRATARRRARHERRSDMDPGRPGAAVCAGGEMDRAGSWNRQIPRRAPHLTDRNAA